MTLAVLSKKAGAILKKRDLLLATAESCTGGGLSYWLTATSGSSEWFERGFITYSNNAKMEMLGVNPETLKKFGAVSEETAKEMARGALEHSHADISIAITGIAGPEGGTTEKPVGTVWFAFALSKTKTTTHVEVFAGDRENVRLSSIQLALETLIKIIGNPADKEL